MTPSNVATCLWEAVTDRERDLCPERMPEVISTLLRALTPGRVPCLQTKR